MKFIISICLFIIITSCAFELDRSNPLDPQSGGLAAPEKVIVYELPLSSIGFVLIQWSIQNDAVGYKIYRSLAYNGNYSLIGEKLTTEDGSYEDISEELVSDTWYYYKVSAFNENGLEGYRSEPVFTRLTR